MVWAICMIVGVAVGISYISPAYYAYSTEKADISPIILANDATELARLQGYNITGLPIEFVGEIEDSGVLYIMGMKGFPPGESIAMAYRSIPQASGSPNPEITYWLIRNIDGMIWATKIDSLEYDAPEFYCAVFDGKTITFERVTYSTLDVLPFSMFCGAILGVVFVVICCVLSGRWDWLE